MPKFYCEYCGIYLTHSSPLGRRQHAEGRKHIQNKIDYYSNLLLEAQRESTQYISNETFKKFFGTDGKKNIESLLKTEPQPNVVPNINMQGINPSGISVLPMPNQQILNLNNPAQQYYQQNLNHAVGNLNNNPNYRPAQMRNPFGGY